MSSEEDIDEQWDADLKVKERIFILHYCTDEACLFDASASYRATYTKKNRETGELISPEQSTCEVNGSRLLKKAKVKKAMRKLLKLTQPELDEENVYKTINLLKNLAFFNPADIIDGNGRLVKELAELGDKAKAISQIRFTQYGAQVQLVDRVKYLELLMKYLNIVRPEQQIDLKLPVIEMVQKSIDVASWNKLSEEQEN